jgi:hypothetical protein
VAPGGGRGPQVGPRLIGKPLGGQEMVGPRSPKVREALFWLLAALALGIIVYGDYSNLFIYVPRFALAVVVALVLFPSRVNASYWARVSATLTLVVLVFALAPVRWGFVKSFYLDCESLQPGISWSQALEEMSHYHSFHPSWSTRVPLEPGASLVVVPSPAYSADW